MKFNPVHMNSVLVEMCNYFQQQPVSVMIYAFKKTKLLFFYPPYHNTNAQARLAATQTPSGTRSEEIKDIDRASMAIEEVKSIRKTDLTVILR